MGSEMCIRDSCTCGQGSRSANNGELHLWSRVKERQQRRTALVVKNQGAPTTANCTCGQESRITVHFSLLSAATWKNWRRLLFAWLCRPLATSRMPSKTCCRDPESRCTLLCFKVFSILPSAVRLHWRSYRDRPAKVHFLTHCRRFGIWHGEKHVPVVSFQPVHIALVKPGECQPYLMVVLRNYLTSTQ